MYTLVIADDEKIEQKVLQKIVQEFCPQVQVTACVSNGMKLVECMEAQHPDIVILDINMPVLDGLGALEIIRLKKIRAKFIVVTAYSKFEFAKKAVSLGAEEYILKPVNEKTLVDTLGRVCAQLDAEKKSRQEKEDQKDYRRMLERELISEMLLGEVSGENCEKYRELVPSAAGAVCTALIRGAAADREEALLTSLKRFCLCFGKRYRESLVLCLFLPEQADGGYRAWIRELSECMKDAGEEIAWETLTAGISRPRARLEELDEALKESQAAIREVRGSGVYFYDEKETQTGNYRKEAEECRKYANAGDSAGFGRAVTRAFRKFREMDLPVDFFRTFTWWVMMDGRFRRDRSFLFYENGWCCWEKIAETEDIGQMEAVLMEWMDLQQEYRRNQDNYDQYILEGLGYMVRYYMDELSLGMTAEAVNISSFYFSRMFKKNLRRTFMEVLTDIRLTCGIDFLYEGKMNIQQISLEIGYPNVSYFYRLFRKKMGMTASEMKNYLQML